MEELLSQARKPHGENGRKTLARMNESHAALADWAFSHCTVADTANALDVGCGGGANIARLLNLCPRGRVCGVDFSDVSVRESSRKNADAVAEGRCSIVQGSVDALPFDADTFDFAVACETVYFWPDIVDSLAQVRRVLVPGGTFLIINEMSDPESEVWAKHISASTQMTVYTGEQLVTLLHEAGFSAVQLHVGTGEWICLTATA